MEDILASIKRIIAEDGAAVAPARLHRNGVAAPPSVAPVPEEDVLELTHQVPRPAGSAPAAADMGAASRGEDRMKADPTLVSTDAAFASRQSLSALSALLVKPAAGEDNTLEGLVRDLLRPMLKEWLDARLPEIVEAIVAREVERITGGV